VQNIVNSQVQSGTRLAQADLFISDAIQRGALNVPVVSVIAAKTSENGARMA